MMAQEKVLEKIMAENFPNLMKTVNPQIQEAQRTSRQNRYKENSPMHVIIRSLQTNKSGSREKISKATKEKSCCGQKNQK